MRSKFIWHGINKDDHRWARCCVDCQTVGRHTDTETGDFPQPSRRFGHHVDVVGPLPPSDSFHYLFTATDRSTRWPEAIPMKRATPWDRTEALLHGWISRFGVPDDITSDRGPAFISQLWLSLGELMGTSVHHTTSCNPAANGMFELTHRTLKATLMTRFKGPDWKAHFPWVLLGMSTSPKEGLHVSSAEMVFAEALAVPGEFFTGSGSATPNDHLSRLRQTVGVYRPCVRPYKMLPPCHLPTSLASCTYIFVRNDAHRTPLTRPYRGPYLVVDRNPIFV